MEKTEFIQYGRRCQLHYMQAPEVLFVEPVDRGDLDFLDSQLEYMQKGCSVPFALATFLIGDWNRELTPWEAPPVFGREGFGDGAQTTLDFIEGHLLQEITEMLPSLRGKEVILGGYSLAALFALWAGYESDSFAAVAAASPSVWYPGWLDYSRKHNPKTGRIYLSLGDGEEKARNAIMSTVGDCIREMDSLLDGIPHTLEWNVGNHFVEADIRTAKAFVWCAEKVDREIIL